MSTKIYVVVNVETGEQALGKTYTTERHAKSAIKNRIWEPNWPKYAVAYVEFTPKIVATVDKDGNWTEATE